MVTASDPATGAGENIAELVRRMLAAEAALRQAIGDEVDAVGDPTGAPPLLLREAQEALYASESRHRALYESITAGIIVHDQTGRVIHANLAACRLLDLTHDQLLGRVPIDALRQTIHEDGSRYSSDTHPAAVTLRTGAQVRGAVMGIPTRAGTTTWLLIDSTPSAHPQTGAMSEVLVTLVDITSLKLAEREAAFQANLLAHVSDAVIALDAEWRVTYLNAAAEHLFETPPAGVLGRHLSEVYAVEWSDADAAGAFADMVARGAWHGEVIDILPDGRRIPVELTVSAIGEGARDGMVAMIRDITERKRVARALEERNRELADALDELKVAQRQMIQQERMRALGQMATGIAHDVNNALTLIIGYSELALARPETFADPATMQTYIEMIYAGAQDAGHVVSRLREFFRPNEPGQTPGSVDLSRLVQRVIAFTQPRWRDQSLANGVTIQIAADLPNLPLVAGKDEEIRELLTNLIFNAVDAMPTGGTLTLRTRADGLRVRLEVSDTGVGMTDEVRLRCLEPFFTTKGDRGTGLGLAMVYGIVRRLHGAIDIASDLGRGTTMTIHLPVQTAPLESVPVPVAEELTGSLRILVVDDNASLRELFSNYLMAHRHSVETAANGRIGLQKFQAANAAESSPPFDVVLTDRAMPEMSGDQLAHEIKGISPTTPVI